MAMNGARSDAKSRDTVWAALDSFHIEVPSWGFANTGTRFGKFTQSAAATTLEEKFADASQVNALTGASPTVALHVLWDLPNGKGDVPEIKRLESKYGVNAGSINPNVFQSQTTSTAQSVIQARKFAVMLWHTYWTRSRLAVSWATRTSHCGLRMVLTIQGPRAFASVSSGWRRSSRQPMLRWVSISGC